MCCCSGRRYGGFPFPCAQVGESELGCGQDQVTVGELVGWPAGPVVQHLALAAARVI